MNPLGRQLAPDGAERLAVALRTSDAEWVQGFSDRLDPDGFRRPTTDHSYEGLLVLLAGESWKILDGIGLRLDDTPLVLESVFATPLEVTYGYQGGWTAGFRLLPGEAGTVLELNLNAPAHADPVIVTVRPVFDLRHMYAESTQDGFQRVIRAPHRVALVGQACVLVEHPSEASFEENVSDPPLTHPMGSGFRSLQAHGLDFVAEQRTGHVAGDFTLVLGDNQQARFRFAVALTHLAAEQLLDTVTEARHLGRQARLDAIAEALGPCPGLAERCFVMTECFGMEVLGARVPEAGGWWFRTPWFRDVFEGLLSNYRTLLALGAGDRLRESLEAALCFQDPVSGRIPNRLPEHRQDLEGFERTGRLPDSYYYSSDATLLAFTLLDELDGALGDPSLDEAAAVAFERAVRAFRGASLTEIDGQPVLHADGLLSAVPWHTWTDGKRSLDSKQGSCPDLPLRVPKAWQQASLDAGETPEAVWRRDHLPTAYLPEINAQWLRMLAWGTRHLKAAPSRSWAESTLALATSSFRPRFWDEASARVANLVRAGRTDWTAGSPGLVALALLKPLEVFSARDRARAWHGVRDRLLVYHRGRPFGLLVKDSEERQYLGDAQYHEAVCWPRETPYLLRLLAELGETELYRLLLANNLDHQQREGVLFYNHELFSFPAGHEAAGGPNGGAALVPVKNPMQWWSQWCDAFLQNRPSCVGSER